MTCDRYWRDGVVLVERGLDDPHRAGCVDCARAHASRGELVDGLPLIGEGHTGDPHWQAQLWRRIEREREPAPRRWGWSLAGALVVACVVVLWFGLGREGQRHEQVAASFEIVRANENVAMRSGSDQVMVDDRLRVTVGKSSEVWIYRGDRLVLRCHAREQSPDCRPDGAGMIVELKLDTPGKYWAFAIEGPVASPTGVLDKDRAALGAAGAVEHHVVVH